MTLRLRTLALLLLPTAVLVGWAVFLTAERTALPSLRTAIIGYDPRDLLRGHYLLFRLDLAPTAGEAPSCGCLEPNPADALRPSVRATGCESRPPDCPYFLKNPRRTFRYYASEEQAPALEKTLAAAPGSLAVTVHFHGDGEASFSDIAPIP